jgi:gluconolactonase
VAAASHDGEAVIPLEPGRPRLVKLRAHAELPEHLRVPRANAWADRNLGGAALGCFLEGPAFDAAGNLVVVDIPYGRILRLSPQGAWEIAYEYDGWPNGLKICPDGRYAVADHKQGLVRIDPSAGRHDILADSFGGVPFLGLNDLALAADGSLYVTDQGETGLHDPHGRLLYRAADGAIACLLDNLPSPNGIVDTGAACLFVALTRANAVWRVPLRDGRPAKVGLFLQLSGGVGPDGLALDGQGGLLVAHPPIGIWHFDKVGAPRALYRIEGDSYTTNLTLRRSGDRTDLFVTDSLRGRILTATLEP